MSVALVNQQVSGSSGDRHEPGLHGFTEVVPEPELGQRLFTSLGSGEALSKSNGVGGAVLATVEGVGYRLPAGRYPTAAGFVGHSMITLRRAAVLAATSALAITVAASPASAGTGLSVNDTVPLEGNIAAISGTYSCQTKDTEFAGGYKAMVTLQVLVTQGSLGTPDYVPGSGAVEVSCPATNEPWQMALAPNTAHLGTKWKTGSGRVETTLLKSRRPDPDFPNPPAGVEQVAELNRTVSID